MEHAASPVPHVPIPRRMTPEPKDEEILAKGLQDIEILQLFLPQITHPATDIAQIVAVIDLPGMQVEGTSVKDGIRLSAEELEESSLPQLVEVEPDESEAICNSFANFIADDFYDCLFAGQLFQISE